MSESGVDGLKPLKLATKETISSKSSPLFEWETVDTWVDDDFDAEELLKGPSNLSERLPQLDSSLLKEPKANRKSHRQRDMQNKEHHRDDKYNTSNNTSRTSRKLNEQKEESRNANRRRRSKELHAPIRDFGKSISKQPEPVSFDKYRTPIPKGPAKLREKGEIRRRRSLDDDISPEQLAKEMARLMPVVGWKPDISDHLDDQGKKQNISKKHTPQKTKKSTNIQRIHYTEGSHASRPSSPGENKIASRWADAKVDVTNASHGTAANQGSTRDRDSYRKKKIAEKLDWDQGIQRRKGEKDLDREDETTEKRADRSLDAAENHTSHEHFSYENGNGLTKDSSLPSRWA